MQELLDLEPYFGIKPDINDVEHVFILTRKESGVTVTIRLILWDKQSNTDVAITNMTTLPYSEVKKGHGRQALQKVLDWALDNRMNDIIATQVQLPSVGFWERCGFVALDNETSDYWYDWL